MPQATVIQLNRPIGSVRISDGLSEEIELPPVNSADKAAADAEQTRLIEQLQAEKNLYNGLCQTLQALTAKLNQFYDEIVAGHKEEIAGLSVEIARKVLMQKVQDSDYKIESIVKEALGNVPTRQGLVVRLNPQDLADFQEVRQGDDSDELSGIEVVADADIGRAECVLDSPKGIIKSLIEDHLEQIEKTLKKTE